MSYPTKAEVVNVIRRKLETKQDFPDDMRAAYELGVMEAASAVQAMVWLRRGA